MDVLSENEIRQLPYQELQKYAKNHGIKANMKSDKLITALLSDSLNCSKDMNATNKLETSFKDNTLFNGEIVASPIPETPRRETYSLESSFFFPQLSEERKSSSNEDVKRTPPLKRRKISLEGPFFPSILNEPKLIVQEKVTPLKTKSNKKASTRKLIPSTRKSIVKSKDKIGKSKVCFLTPVKNLRSSEPNSGSPFASIKGRPKTPAAVSNKRSATRRNSKVQNVSVSSVSKKLTSVSGSKRRSIRFNVEVSTPKSAKLPESSKSKRTPRVTPFKLTPSDRQKLEFDEEKPESPELKSAKLPESSKRTRSPRVTPFKSKPSAQQKLEFVEEKPESLEPKSAKLPASSKRTRSPRVTPFKSKPRSTESQDQQKLEFVEEKPENPELKSVKLPESSKRTRSPRVTPFKSKPFDQQKLEFVEEKPESPEPKSAKLLVSSKRRSPRATPLKLQPSDQQKLEFVEDESKNLEPSDKKEQESQTKTPLPTPKQNRTNASPRTITPNFNKIHQKAFEKMESIKEYHERKNTIPVASSGKRLRKPVSDASTSTVMSASSVKRPQRKQSAASTAKKAGSPSVKTPARVKRRPISKIPKPFSGVPFIPSVTALSKIKTNFYEISNKASVEKVAAPSTGLKKKEEKKGKRNLFTPGPKGVEVMKFGGNSVAKPQVSSASKSRMTADKKTTKENQVARKTKFNLAASLAKKLPYKPYTGALKPLTESGTNTTTSQKQKPAEALHKKNQTVEKARNVNRNVLQGVRKNRRFELQMNRRGLAK